MFYVANINYKDADGRSTLYFLALENKIEMAKILLENGADVDCIDLEGRTGLHVSCWQGHYDVSELLIAHGADVNAVDNDQRTPLQSAAWQGHDRVVKLLLEKGAVVDHTCNQGVTALCIASQEGHEETVQVLLLHKANPNHADQFGRTPVRVAMKSGHINVCKLLEEFGAVVPIGSKSRSNSSTSSNETRPSISSAANPVSGVVVNGNQLVSSPSESPDSTFDRRKSYASNNSSKSSSNFTSSTNQSGQSTHLQSNSDCLTFTQQLQQCSMTRNRTRPVSRVLSPVSEPQTPVQSPPLSPMVEIHNNFNSKLNKVSPVTERNLNILAPSPVKFSNCKQSEIKATINIITNPNADLVDEPIWQVNPMHFKNMKSELEKLKLTQKPENRSEQPSKLIMGQNSLRSPEMRRKRNGIVTNPNLTHAHSKNNSMVGKISNFQNEDDKLIGSGINQLSSKSQIYNGVNSSHQGPARPNGLPLKKETPL